MFFKPRINPKKQGISIALEMKKDTKNISQKTSNKILQILYNDLLDISNIFFDTATLRRKFYPSGEITRYLVVNLIRNAGVRNKTGHLIGQEINCFFSERIFDENILSIDGFHHCRLLLARMFSKCLFALEIETAKNYCRKVIFYRATLVVKKY
ncbi:hypothetical protein [Enterobacter sp. Bisph1]|uniref:hypothetical protein n=1 Tax=Enterobacter sp. Bisph1 TaxID=1274399 RepID=UPI00057C21E2|nr:hypothetical protein [Enterobacter sp. Bisph1]